MSIFKSKTYFIFFSDLALTEAPFMLP